MAYEDELLKEIVKTCRNAIEPIKQEEIAELKLLLQELNNRVTDKLDIFSGQTEKSRETWERAGLEKSYLTRGSYSELLEIITKILDILRGRPLEIVIQKIQRDSKGEIKDITIYKGKESQLATKTVGKFQQVQYDLDSSIKNLEKIERANEVFKRHYSQFYNIAQEHIKSVRSGKGNQWRKKINEGNIVEAFQRHMQLKHMDDNIETMTLSEKINPVDVIVSLYYSIGNIPWWQQGDIGYLQVKANNLKLASWTSIRRVATKLKEMFKDIEHFDFEEFNKMFTAHDQKQMVDFSELAEDEQQNIIKQIKNNPNFKNITVKMSNI